jgi:hypothetical protein
MSKIGSGRNGQVASSKFVAGSKSPSAIPPGTAGRIGTAEVRTSKPAAAKTITAAVPLGNELAKNVGAGGPGKGRTVHGTGSQGKH